MQGVEEFFRPTGRRGPGRPLPSLSRDTGPAGEAEANLGIAKLLLVIKLFVRFSSFSS